VKRVVPRDAIYLVSSFKAVNFLIKTKVSVGTQ
jgi:hypothetical protein